MRCKIVLMSFLIGLAAVAFGPSTADASHIIGWEDNDFENLYDLDGSGDFSEDDLIVGIFQTQKVGDAGTDPTGWSDDDTYVATFVQLVTGVTPGAGQYGGALAAQIDFGPTPWVDANFDGFDDTWASFGLIRTEGPMPAGQGTVAVIWRDFTGISADVDGSGPSVEGAPTLWPLGPVGSADPVIWDELQTAQDGTMLWEIGLTGAGQEFWTADVNNATIPVPAGLALDFVGSGNVTMVGAGGTSLPHSYFSSLPAAIRPALWVDMEGVHGAPIVSQWQMHGSKGDVLPGDFHLSTDTDIFHAIPDPSTGLIFLGLFGLAAWRRARRKSG
jgi:hypothetical protein